MVSTHTPRGVTRKIAVVALFFCSLSTASFAIEEQCSNSAILAPHLLNPPIAHTVNGNGRLYFYTAPNYSCRTKDIFVIQGDTLNVHTEVNEWYLVDYYNPRTKKTHEGWVRPERLKSTDKRMLMRNSVASTPTWCSPISITGTLKKDLDFHWGREEQITVYYLEMTPPITIPLGLCDGFKTEKVTTKEVQILNDTGAVEQLIGKTVTVTGKLLPPETAWHVMPAILIPLDDTLP